MELIKVKTEEEFIKHAIRIIKEIVDKSTNVCRIALSGGSTPEGLYKELPKSDVDFSKVEFYQVDERYVPKEDENSNYKLITQSLVNPLKERIKAFYHFKTELPIDQCVNDYAEQIEKINFDLVILGMGTDGHVASLFPGDKKSLDSAMPALYTTTDQFAVKDRLTISLNKIQSAKNILLLLKGEKKKEILQTLLDKNSSIYDLPAKSLWTNKNFVILFSPFL